VKQYVKLFELNTSEFTQDMSYDIAAEHAGNAYAREYLNKKQVYPSRELGERIGLRIWREWNMPYDWDSDRTFRVFFANYKAFQKTKDESEKDECLGRISDISNELLNRNSELRGIRNYNRHMPDILYGMVSMFNFDDIEIYIRMRDDDKIVGEELRKDPQYGKLHETVESMLRSAFPDERVVLRWVAAPETLIKIKNRLDEIEKQR